MDKSYRVQEDIKCCETCEYSTWDWPNDWLTCSVIEDEFMIYPLGICDKYEESE